MKIIAKRPDYYDYIEHVYGADPLVVYNRTKINTVNLNVTHHGIALPDMAVRSLPTNLEREYDLGWVIVTGRYFLIYRPIDLMRQPLSDWRIAAMDGEVITRIVDGYKSSWWAWGNNGELATPEYYFDSPSNDAVLIHRATHQPVLRLCRSTTYIPHPHPAKGMRGKVVVLVYDEIPHLESLGMASFISAERMYHDISYFMSNTINESPDTKPPVEVADIHKIAAAGFDTKISFRKRKGVV